MASPRSVLRSALRASPVSLLLHLSVGCFCVGSVVGQVVPQVTPEPGRAAVSYGMRVRLEPEARRLVGTQTIRWSNPAPKPVAELRFHTYLNAFRDRRSTFMTEGDAAFRAQWREGDFGGVDVASVVVRSDRSDEAERLAASLEYIAPDDGNADDRTVLRASLPRPVGPGETVVIETSFEVALPKALRRTGWLPGNGFFCMQWFPKLGVLEVDEHGEPVWDCAQFHHNGEFHADFAESYEVAIQVPAAFVVGATGGRPVSETDVGGGYKELLFRQENVHDFAFVADPDFVVEERDLGPYGSSLDPGGVATEVDRVFGTGETIQPSVRVRVLLQPQHATKEQFDRHFGAVECGLRFYGLRFGPYPYEVLTVVDPGRDITGRVLGGGMEYPTLITCGSVPAPHPRRMTPESVTVHEFGHQFFYGLLANDELEEAWLDEGFTTYTEGRAQWLCYGESRRPAQTTSYGEFTTFAATPVLHALDGVTERFGRLPIATWLPDHLADELERHAFEGRIVPGGTVVSGAWPLAMLAAVPTAAFAREAGFSDFWNDRRRLLAADNPDALRTPSYAFLTRGAYVANAYHRPAMLLRTLERMVGKVRWWSFLRRYHQDHRYRHTTGDDFVGALEQAFGAEVAEFFRLATEAGAVFDYGIERVGRRGDAQEVVVRRRGGIRADVDVRFRFADGREVVRSISSDDEKPWWTFRFERDEEGVAYSPLTEVWVDPPSTRPSDALDVDGFEGPPGPVGVYPIDVNLLDNAWRAEHDHFPALYRAMRALQQVQFELGFAALAG
jgi:hypothetical protein